MKPGSGFRPPALTTVSAAFSRTNPPALRQTAPGTDILGHSGPDQSPPILPEFNQDSSAGGVGYPFTLRERKQGRSRWSGDISRRVRPVTQARATDGKRPEPRSLAKDNNVLRRRMKLIISALMLNENTTDGWRTYIGRHSPSTWAGIILRSMPEQFRHMLAGATSPQPEDLAALPWTARNCAGVYATILEGGTYHAPSPGFSVRLASVALRGGLREQWAWAKDPKHRTEPVFYEDRHLAKTTLKAKRRLVELFVTRPLTGKTETDAETKDLVMFAEAIIAAWFGAPIWMETTCDRAVLNLSPWNPLSIERESQGDHSYHPLGPRKQIFRSLPPSKICPQIQMIPWLKMTKVTLESSKDTLVPKTKQVSRIKETKSPAQVI